MLSIIASEGERKGLYLKWRGSNLLYKETFSPNYLAYAFKHSIWGGKKEHQQGLKFHKSIYTIVGSFTRAGAEWALAILRIEIPLFLALDQRGLL